MKYLRKFATQSDYDAYVESGMETPNVSLVAESYTTFFTKKEIEIPLGVFIQHINGKLYTADEWTAKGFSNDEANGVAVSAEECAFVIAKTYAAKNSSLSWGDSKTKINDIVSTEKESVAILDYDGASNTEKIIKQLSGITGAPVSEVCANYTFPNGKKGYLPAYGEWKLAYDHKSEIVKAMSIIGGTEMSLGNHWSSTQYFNIYDINCRGWLMSWYDGHSVGNYGNNQIRAFTTL